MHAVRTRLRRSLDTTFAIHVADTLVAAVISTLLSAELHRFLGDGPRDAVRRGLVFEGLNAWIHAESAHRSVLVVAGLVALHALLSPLFAMTWSLAIVDGVGFAESARRAPRLYVPSLLGRALAFGTALPFLAIAAVLPIVAHLALRTSPDVSTHDLVVLAACLPLPLCVLVGLTFSDLLELALVVDGPRILEAWLLGLRALRLRTVAESLVSRGVRLIASVGAAVLAGLASRDMLLSVLALAASQALLLASRGVRALWLARATARIEAVR